MYLSNISNAVFLSNYSGYIDRFILFQDFGTAGVKRQKPMGIKKIKPGLHRCQLMTHTITSTLKLLSVTTGY
jgi:hypothetical protein